MSEGVDALWDIIREADACFAELSGLAKPAPGIFFAALPCWSLFLVSETEALEGAISDVRNKAKSLVRALEGLEKLLDHFLRIDWQPLTLNHKGLFRDSTELQPEMQERLSNDIPHLRATLSKLTKTLDQVTPVHQRGNTRGHKNYPGLTDLVYSLELEARKHGGKFTFHRKHGVPKGTLIEALNWLRSRLAASPDTKPWAGYIPVPARHPVNVYEAALQKARRHAVRGEPVAQLCTLCGRKPDRYTWINDENGGEGDVVGPCCRPELFPEI